MSKFLSLLALVFTPILAAETIGSVEYKDIAMEEGWTLNEFENEAGQFKVYSKEDLAGGSFIATHLANPIDFNMDDLEKGMQAGYPDLTFKLEVLDDQEDALLYEWSAADTEKAPKACGWGRIFKKESVMLGFQTDQVENVDTLRTKWVAGLKEAKVTAPALLK